MFSLNSNKSIGPNIPTRILKLLKNDNSTSYWIYLTSHSLQAFFPTIAKVILVHKKHSKLDFSNYCPIPLF